jgi:aminotransferase
MTIPVNPAVAAIPYGDRKRIMEMCRGREGLVDLMSGNPYQQMPEWIRRRTMQLFESGPMRYTHYWGMPELRQRLAQKLQDECGIGADPETEVLVTHGVQEALYAVMRTLLRPGDEVLIPTPHYANYLLNTVACAAEPVFVPLKEADGFLPDVRQLETALTDNTRLIVFSNPNNPLGITWPDSTVRELAEFALQHDLLVVVDEIYRDFAHPDPPLSIASLPGMRERTFTLQGFSKSYFMMGMRIGYLCGPEEVVWHVKQLHYLITLCPSRIAQYAALAALDCPGEFLEPMYREYREKLRILYEGIRRIPGVSCVRPSGSFYAFANFSCFGLRSVELAAELVREAGGQLPVDRPDHHTEALDLGQPAGHDHRIPHGIVPHQQESVSSHGRSDLRGADPQPASPGADLHLLLFCCRSDHAPYGRGGFYPQPA